MWKYHRKMVCQMYFSVLTPSYAMAVIEVVSLASSSILQKMIWLQVWKYHGKIVYQIGFSVLTPSHATAVIEVVSLASSSILQGFVVWLSLLLGMEQSYLQTVK